MSTPVFMVILLSAFLHALGSAVIKQGHNRYFEVVLILFTGAVISWLSFLFLPLPQPESYKLLALTLPFHFIFNLSVPMLYNRLDMSVAYTVMRGAAPFFTALGMLLIFGVGLSFGSWMGIALLSCGILLLGAENALKSKAPFKAFTAAVLVSTMSASYTLVDSVGIIASGNAFSFASALFICLGTPLMLFTLTWHRKEFVPYIAQRWKITFPAGVLSYASYAIFLWALSHAPVAHAAALRETSVIFALIISFIILKEKIRIARVAAVFMVFCGVVLLRVLG